MKVITDQKRIDEILNRGVVVNILPSREEFVKILTSGKRLKIYIGADPTSDSLHLSHAKNYMFLEELRQLGHEVFILVGDFTAQIGDPSDRQATRTQLSQKQVKANVKSWLSQIKPLLNFSDSKNPPKVVYNSKWLEKLSFSEILSLASNFTVQQMIERDMFTKRWEKNAPIYLHEFLYPLMQGYDSVVLNVDVELCGTDQIFNALAGRTLLKRLKNKDKFVVAVNLMENPKTGELMSKSQGTGVFLSSPPNDMFGALMAQPDEMTEVLLVNCTRIPLEEKKEIFAKGPKEAKVRVAWDIVKTFYGLKKADTAKDSFEKIFSKKEMTDDIPEIKVPHKKISASELILLTRVGESRSQARRLIEQGGLKVNDQKIQNPIEVISLKAGDVVKIGKHHFFRVK